MSDLEVLQKMAESDQDITACPDIIQTEKVKQGGLITIGVPDVAYQKISPLTSPQTHYAMLYIINAAQFDALKYPERAAKKTP